MPSPRKEGESTKDFISRCISEVYDEYETREQAIAVCIAKSKEKMSKQEEEMFVLQPRKSENRGTYLTRCSKNSKMKSQHPNLKERMNSCLNAFNSYYKYWAKLEEFAEVPKDSALGQCIAKKKSQGIDYKQAYKECASKVVVPSGTIVLAEDLNIYGVRPKHFDICPMATELFKHFVEMGLDEETVGMVRSAALVADRVFEIEKDVIENESVDQNSLMEAVALVEDFKDIIEEVDEETGMKHDVSFMDAHIEKIKSYVEMSDDLIVEPVLD